MTEMFTILPMRESRRIFFTVYDGFELLDMSGPAAVFSTANRMADTEAYRVELVSIGGGPVSSSSGVTVETKACRDVRPGCLSTILVMGSDERELRHAVEDGSIGKWLIRMSPRVERLGSVCTGSFILASAGLLASRTATTHWAASKALSTLFSDIALREDALYVVDGRVWTSAGVSTGIDMALAMVHADLGQSMMRDVAKRLVVYAHRPGNQSQFSALLEAQSMAPAFSDLISWLDANLHREIKVADMARQASMSERTFARRFTADTQVSPAKFLEGLRLHRGKVLIERGVPPKQVAFKVGYGSLQGFRSAFEDAFGVTPAHHARMCGRAGKIAAP
ncbi:MAG: DJ-1/PfpI family protein [Myxococcota bacterium]